jgi:hypothetical protein
LPVARPVVFTPAAQAEVAKAQAWYEAQAPGPGGRFRAERDATRSLGEAGDPALPQNIGQAAQQARRRRG